MTQNLQQQQQPPLPSRKDKQLKEDLENENKNKDGVFEYKRRYADKRN